MRFFVTVWLFWLGINTRCSETRNSFPGMLDEKEKSNLDAIAKIHRHLDDDKNGNVDLKESIGFIHDELMASDMNSRQSHFHGKDHNMISVNDLWRTWRQSEVHNWTNSQVVSWIVEFVHLPQYKDIFSRSTIDGSMLPRLAEPKNGFLLNELGIKDPKHRKKIALRAMDIVLFGPPVVGHYFLKDLVVAASVIVATVGCWAAVTQKKKAKKQMENMMKDIEILQQAEQNYHDLQEKLMKAEEEQQIAIEEKLNLEARLKDELQMSKREAESIHDARIGTEEQLQRFKLAEQELQMLREALKKAEKELECQAWHAPPALRQWLHMTYEKETKHFQLKRAAALKKMEEAKESCERIRKKRGSLMGSFRLAHDLTIDEVDQKILGARAALADVSNEMEERQQRWSQIESLCGLNIQEISNYSLGTAAGKSVPKRSRSNSVVAQALVGCANIGSVGSGRKLSSNKEPELNISTSPVSASPASSSSRDLPPTYSTAVMEAKEMISDSLLERTTKDQSTSPLHKPETPKCVHTTSQVLETVNGHDESQTGNGANHIKKRNDEVVMRRSSSASACVVDDSPSSSTSSSSKKALRPISDPGSEVLDCTSTDLCPISPKGSPNDSKSRRRQNWFSRKRTGSEGETASIQSSGSLDEESRHKKMKGLWRMAINSSRVQRRQNGKGFAVKKDQPATSNQKLKAG